MLSLLWISSEDSYKNNSSDSHYLDYAYQYGVFVNLVSAPSAAIPITLKPPDQTNRRVVIHTTRRQWCLLNQIDQLSLIIKWLITCEVADHRHGNYRPILAALHCIRINLIADYPASHHREVIPQSEYSKCYYPRIADFNDHSSEIVPVSPRLRRLADDHIIQCYDGFCLRYYDRPSLGS